MARPDRRPAARRTRHRACADRDQVPEAGTRWRPRPRSITPSRIASGGSSASERPAGPTASVAGATSGRNTRSTASSISLSIGSSVTTQFCTTVAETRPTTRSPSAPVPRQIEPGLEPRQRGEAGRLGDGVPRGAVRHEIEPPARFRDIAATVTGTLQAGMDDGFREVWSASWRHRFRVGKIKLPARQRLRRLARRAAGSPRAYRRPAAGRPAAAR